MSGLLCQCASVRVCGGPWRVTIIGRVQAIGGAHSCSNDSGRFRFSDQSRYYERVHPCGTSLLPVFRTGFATGSGGGGVWTTKFTKGRERGWTFLAEVVCFEAEEG
jgi:hypothetical protein